MHHILGLIVSFSVGRSDSMRLEISHLLFADDTIIFVTMTAQIINLRCILVWFEAISSLRVTLSKSSTLPIGKMENAYALMDCKLDSLPSSYLGLPLSAKFKDKSIWESVVEKFEKIFWLETRYLSKGEGLTLIKASSLVSHLLSFTLSHSLFSG